VPAPFDISDPWSFERHEMVEQQIAARGIADARVLKALGRVPRERFVLPEYAQDAYADKALPIGYGATISQPYIVAAMMEALRTEPGQTVLEVGTGSGYQSSLLALMGMRVHTMERSAELSTSAEQVVRALAAERPDFSPLAGVIFRVGDGSLGWPEAAPFDRIIVTAGAPSIPPTLLGQLRDGGIMVLPVGEAGAQTLVSVEKKPGRTVERPLMACRFVPLLGREGWANDAGDRQE
jgi:protein-L-isoaspartate(D-aspartate) O-methyltransferase